MPYSERFTIHTTIRRNCMGLGSSPRASRPSSTARRMPISAPPAVQAGVVYPATPEAEVSGGSGIVLVNTTLPTALRHLTPHPGLIMFIVQMPPPIYPKTSPLICFARPCSGAGKLEDFSGKSRWDRQRLFMAICFCSKPNMPRHHYAELWVSSCCSAETFSVFRFG